MSVNEEFQTDWEVVVEVADQWRWQSAMISPIGAISSKRVKQIKFSVYGHEAS